MPLKQSNCLFVAPFLSNIFSFTQFSVLLVLILTCAGVRAQSTSIPLNVENWQYRYWNPGMPEEQERPPDSGVFEKTSEGLKFYDYGSRGLARITTKDNFRLSNATLYVKWKVNGNGGWGFFWIEIPNKTTYDRKFNWLSATYSYAGTVVVNNNEWYYTKVAINPSLGFTSVTARNNYDDQGGSVIQTLTGILPGNGSDTDKISISFNDTYAATVFTVVGEVKLRSFDTFPVVSNVRASQRAQTRMVDIYYNLASTNGLSFVSVSVSTNNGVTYDLTAPSMSNGGDINSIGSGVTPGLNKWIQWNAGADWNDKYSDKIRFRINAVY